MAIPLLVSTGAWTVIRLHRPHVPAAVLRSVDGPVLPAGMVHFAIVCFPLGMASYVNTFVAKYQGAGHSAASGRSLARHPFGPLLPFPVSGSWVPLSPWIFRWARHGSELAVLETLLLPNRPVVAGGPRSWPLR